MCIRDRFYVVGNTTSAMDLSSSFGEDNLLISVLSALFVILAVSYTHLDVYKRQLPTPATARPWSAPAARFCRPGTTPR